MSAGNDLRTKLVDARCGLRLYRLAQPWRELSQPCQGKEHVGSRLMLVH